MRITSWFAARCDRLAAEECFDGKRPAVNFAALEAEIDVGAAGIAGDDLKLGADGFLQQFGKVRVRPGDAVAPIWAVLGRADFSMVL